MESRISVMVRFSRLPSAFLASGFPYTGFTGDFVSAVDIASSDFNCMNK